MESMDPARCKSVIYLAIVLILLRTSFLVDAKKGSSGDKAVKYVNKLYGPGFLNHSGCLYAHIGGGLFEMTTADGYKINETLDLGSLEFESTKTKCTTPTQAGKLTFSFGLEDNKRVNSIVVVMRITPLDSQGYWEISQANLTVTRSDIDRKRTFAMRLPAIYAGHDFSYSCSALSLSSQPKRRTENETRNDPLAIVTLDRFQLQPFAELERVIFASSYDCSSWVTIPGFMGLILILFMLFVTMIGIVLLKNIVTNDFKFNKEGLLFTQSQMETNKNR